MPRSIRGPCSDVAGEGVLVGSPVGSPSASDVSTRTEFCSWQSWLTRETKVRGYVPVVAAGRNLAEAHIEARRTGPEGDRTGLVVDRSSYIV